MVLHIRVASIDSLLFGRCVPVPRQVGVELSGALKNHLFNGKVTAKL